MTAPRTLNEVIATGGGFIDYDPLKVLMELQAAISYRDGYVIDLGADSNSYLMRRIKNCIAFNTGGDTYMTPKEKP